MREPLKVFISYSRKDEALKDMLLEHLRVLERFRGVKVWTDAEIPPGAMWREEIDRAMATTDVALLLISAAFLASDFIQTAELPELLKRQTRTGLVVIPVILRECSWEDNPAIKPFQVLPKGAEPIAKHSGHKRDVALKQVASAIAALAKEHAKRSRSAVPQPEPAPEPFALRLVASSEEICANVSAFHTEARSAPNRAQSLLRQTTYWVCDRVKGAFGPAKFVGFAGMSLDRYAEANAGRLTGDVFDGHRTRTAIERVLGCDFAPSRERADDLVRWGEALFGKGAFGNADRTKWSFVTLGSDTVNSLPAHGHTTIEQAYRRLRDARGTRLTASELFQQGHSPFMLRAAYGGWFDFVDSEHDLGEPEQRVLRVSGEWLRDLEDTKMSKCFKMITLEALINANALTVGLAAEELSRRSHAILLRSPDLLLDLPEPFRVPGSVHAGSPPRSSNAQRFTAYWKKNPIAAWTTGPNRRWFALDGERLVSKIPCPRGHEAVLAAMTRELIDYQLARYRARSTDDIPTVSVAARVTGDQCERILKLGSPETSEELRPSPGDDLDDEMLTRRFGLKAPPRSGRVEGHLFICIEAPGALVAPDRIRFPITDRRQDETAFVLLRPPDSALWKYIGIAHYLEDEELWAFTAVDYAMYRALGADRASSRSLPVGARARALALTDEIVRKYGPGAVLECGGRRLRIVSRTDGGGLRIDGGPGGFAERTISPTDIAWVLIAADDVRRHGGHLDEQRVNRLRYIEGTPKGSTRWIDTQWAILLVSEG
jgi:hypothetical protein